MTELNVRPLAYALGAEITGLDLTTPLAADTIAEILQTLRKAVVVCIPGQNLSEEQMIAFCGRFGELHPHVVASERHPDHPAITMIVNKPVTVKGKSFPGGIGDEWHTDNAGSIQPPSLSFLNAQELPQIGGDTVFANTYMAYDSLSPRFRDTIDSLEGVFDVSISDFFRRASPEKQAEVRKRNPPVVHSIVRVHPETGRRALYLSTRLRNFLGMTEDESRPLRDYLLEHATRYEFTYRHAWKPYDLVVWDNRCALHRAVTDYDRGALRRMIRCELRTSPTGYFYSEAEAAPSTLR